MGGYATRVNRFLSLTLSHDDRYAPSSFLALRPGSRALVRSFPLVRLPWLVAGDDQHMARSWDRACPVETTGSIMRRRRCPGRSLCVGGRRGTRRWLGCGCIGYVRYRRFGCLQRFGGALSRCVNCRYGRLFRDGLLRRRLLRGVFLFLMQRRVQGRGSGCVRSVGYGTGHGVERAR